MVFSLYVQISAGIFPSVASNVYSLEVELEKCRRIIEDWAYEKNAVER